MIGAVHDHPGPGHVDEALGQRLPHRRKSLHQPPSQIHLAVGVAAGPGQGRPQLIGTELVHDLLATGRVPRPRRGTVRQLDDVREQLGLQPGDLAHPGPDQIHQVVAVVLGAIDRIQHQGQEGPGGEMLQRLQSARAPPLSFGGRFGPGSASGLDSSLNFCVNHSPGPHIGPLPHALILSEHTFDFNLFVAALGATTVFERALDLICGQGCDRPRLRG